jgi:hypothetical protein
LKFSRILEIFQEFGKLKNKIFRSFQVFSDVFRSFYKFSGIFKNFRSLINNKKKIPMSKSKFKVQQLG